MHKVLIRYNDGVEQGFDEIENVVRANDSIILTSGVHKFVVPEGSVRYYFIEALPTPEPVEIKKEKKVANNA